MTSPTSPADAAAGPDGLTDEQRRLVRRLDAVRGGMRAQRRPVNTGPCPGCGRPGDPDPRYAGAFCPVCVTRARCPHDRPVRLSNVSLSGGLAAAHADDGTGCAAATAGPVTIDGTAGLAAEKKFGGVTVWPAPPAS